RHAGAKMLIGAACIRKTLPESTTWVGPSVPITWGSSPTPSLAPGFNTSDSVAAVLDAVHDWYVIIHLKPGGSNLAVQPYESSRTDKGDLEKTCGAIIGNQTATLDASPFQDLNNQLEIISQVLTA